MLAPKRKWTNRQSLHGAKVMSITPVASLSCLPWSLIIPDWKSPLHGLTLSLLKAISSVLTSIFLRLVSSTTVFLTYPCNPWRMALQTQRMHWTDNRQNSTFGKEGCTFHEGSDFVPFIAISPAHRRVSDHIIGLISCMGNNWVSEGIKLKG